MMVISISKRCGLGQPNSRGMNLFLIFFNSYQNFSIATEVEPPNEARASLWSRPANFRSNALARERVVASQPCRRSPAKPDGPSRAGQVALVATFRRGCIERFINPIVAARFLLVPNLSEEDINPERRADENVDGAQSTVAFRTGMRIK